MRYSVLFKVIEENAVQQVKEEVQIQRVCGHFSFIVNCPFYWQSRRRLYIGKTIKEIIILYVILGLFFYSERFYCWWGTT